MLNLAYDHSSLVSEYRPPGLVVGYPDRGGAVLSFAQWRVLRGKESWILPVGKVRFFDLTGSG